jgi:hypothetical protein
MSAIEMGPGVNVLKIGAAVTVLATEVLVAIALLVVVLG